MGNLRIVPEHHSHLRIRTSSISVSPAVVVPILAKIDAHEEVEMTSEYELERVGDRKTEVEEHKEEKDHHKHYRVIDQHSHFN
jgi:hypothetical protein